MWIAEGLIHEKSGISLEETAENYLEDLINWNLVKVEKMRPDGRVKTCRIDDMVRNFCINEARNENFLQEMKRSVNELEPSIAELEKVRRLCIDSNLLNFLYLKPRRWSVRSFVCFSKKEVQLSRNESRAILSAFELLRVLEAKSIKFTTIPHGMYRLVHLKYLTLSVDLSILPHYFSSFFNIQTLIIDTTSHTVEIKANIWKMVQLRHLKINAVTTLPETGKGSKEGETSVHLVQFHQRVAEKKYSKGLAI
ncbi:UNVERIFIED_CONTAM: putative late blight resistance proteinR1B-19 [Sesamum latifolium]|uniref:Late blight resistance proteinR1B-19 n=1 Tax=Sesamum latifolium TaxID=2727402 RepID=A0AAW2TDB3_9LAMI